MRKSSKRTPFDWNILKDIPKPQCLLAYVKVKEPKTYWPGSENLPKTLEIVEATYTVCGIIKEQVGDFVMVNIGIARTQSDQHCKNTGRKYAIERALDSKVVIALDARKGHIGKQFREIAPLFCHIKMLPTKSIPDADQTTQTTTNSELLPTIDVSNDEQTVSRLEDAQSIGEEVSRESITESV